MAVTRDVVRDLLPLYASGEASADTRTLVEEWTHRDAPLAAELAALGGDVFDAAIAPGPAQAERLVLKRTKALLRQRTGFLVGAVLCTALPFSFEFGSAGFRFMFIRVPVVFNALLLVAGVCWTMFYLTVRRLRVSGL